jgi:hypothetical protein
MPKNAGAMASDIRPVSAPAPEEAPDQEARVIISAFRR